MLNHNRKPTSAAVPATEPAAPKKLTPTQDLILEVLGARRRTGEPFWPFSKTLTKSIRGLQEAGFVEWWDASYGNHNVRLTPAGEAVAFPSATYSSPLEKALVTVKTRLEIITAPSEYRPFVHPDNRGVNVSRDLAIAKKALNDAADAIQALHTGEKKASVDFLRTRADNVSQADIE
jgi:hypothetical protein